MAPPAASRYSRPVASRIVEPWASTATGRSGSRDRRKTRPVRSGEAGWSTDRSYQRPAASSRMGRHRSGVGTGPGGVVYRLRLTVEGRPLEDERRTDAELIERARGGEIVAYEELVRR